MVTGSSQSTSICPPHSPTRITKKSILKLPGAFHWLKTSRIRFWAFSYSIGEPCGRSNQLITYFIAILRYRPIPRITSATAHYGLLLCCDFVDDERMGAAAVKHLSRRCHL